MTMECCKTLIAAIIVVTLSSVARTAPLSSSPGPVERLIKLGLIPNLANATNEIQKVYPFIASHNALQNTVLYFGPTATQTCYRNLPLKDKLSVAYVELYYFISPLYMAYSYEEMRGPQHIQLADSLSYTSFYLNSTVSTLRHEIKENKFQPPAGQIDSETHLDNRTRQHLQFLVHNKVVTLVITDDMVKTYRNYVILYTLHDVIKGLQDCVTGL